MALHVLRARIGDLHSRHRQLQWAASLPHWPPPAPTWGHLPKWGHMGTLLVRLPHDLEVGARPS